eukprot:1593776-Prymnesium_polylepis.1
MQGGGGLACVALHRVPHAWARDEGRSRRPGWRSGRGAAESRAAGGAPDRTGMGACFPQFMI